MDSADALPEGQWRLAAPMYEVRGTMYDLRIRARCAGIFAKQVRTRVDEAVRGICLFCWIVLQSARARQGKRIRKCVCLCTMYDGGRQGLPMYDVRCTMYDCRIRALCAGQQSGSGRDGGA